MKFLLPILFALVTLPSLANAQQMLNIYCEECRDLTQHPEDARNFSYNQVFGTVQWLSMDQADRFRITDGFGNTVTIRDHTGHHMMTAELMKPRCSTMWTLWSSRAQSYMAGTCHR